MKVVILAGGLGTRLAEYREYSKTISKWIYANYLAHYENL